MPRRKQDIERSVGIGGYYLVSQTKLKRVIEGVVQRGGKAVGGLGKDADPSDILAHYDRFGGLILTKEGRKVANGSFWDVKEGKKREKPEVMLIMRDITGEEVLIPEGDALPPEVQAAEVADKKREEKAEAKRKAKEEAKKRQKDANKKHERE